MPIDLGGNFVVSANTTSLMNIASTSTNPAFRVDSAGSTLTPKQIGFMAGWSSDPGWQWLTHSTYATFQFNATNYNVGSCFNTANGRFTAPVNGTYLFHATSYFYKNSGFDGSYVYIWFSRNGNQNYLDVKVRGHVYTAGNYFSGEIAQYTYLNAGDYVEYVVYTSASNDTSFEVYPYYGHFEGALVG